MHSVPAAKAFQPCRSANLHPTATNWRVVDTATLCLVNQVRIAHGLDPLRANRELRKVAASQVTTMVSRDYFSDDRPTGQTPLALVAITHYPAHAAEFAVGENIAWGTGSFTTPAHIVAEWMASPPHREVMLSAQYRDAGVAVTAAIPAVLDAGPQGATYAIEFGVRLF
ncbi:MAG TPA: CAP domain-containing protein [Solirubrobacteraceae bacterium]|nr:CAP domain-containing protein [Solirubrobacteraceae bacterium]